MLTEANYQKGFLIDEELMAGVSVVANDTAQSNSFVAFVMLYTTGEYLGYQPFSDLSEALAAINQIPRAWTYESSSSCGGGACGKTGCGPEGECPGNCSQADGSGVCAL